jgi:hypothetical protein
MVVRKDVKIGPRYLTFAAGIEQIEKDFRDFSFAASVRYDLLFLVVGLWFVSVNMEIGYYEKVEG